MRISSLRSYQRRRRDAPRFDDLPPDQRAVAEAHYQRLCSRWGDDLPQWRRAILVGRAKDLVLRPRDANWGRALRKGRRRQPAAPAVSASAPPPAVASPSPAARALPPTQVASLSSAAGGRLTSRHAPANMAFPQPAHVASFPAANHVASSRPAPSTPMPPSPHAVRLDIRGITASGRDGADTAQRILRDVGHHAFGESPHFSIAVPGADLPAGWMWRLEVVPVS